MNTKRTHGGFTLIELLVVIAIISLLMSILLPALGRAREESRATVCLSNVKQITLAFFHYANEYGKIPGTYWQGGREDPQSPIYNLDWSGWNNKSWNPNSSTHPMTTSVLRSYFNEVYKIFECPTAQRDANKYYDYTVVIRLAGARTDLRWYMTYAEKPEQWPAGPNEAMLRRFTAIPFLIEEDYWFYNHGVVDGSWANLDQITDRHSKYANLGYLDGSAGRFKSPKGPNPEVAEAHDLTAWSLQLWVDRKNYQVASSGPLEYGWVNQPK